MKASKLLATFGISAILASSQIIGLPNQKIEKAMACPTWNLFCSHDVPEENTSECQALGCSDSQPKPLSSTQKMILSNKSPSLAINAWEGAQHGTVLRLHNKCVPSNPDCTWTYKNGMFISDKNPSLAINAWEGAQHGTVLRLHNKCVPSNPDCTWSLR
jgi:hypothetical protein